MLRYLLIILWFTASPLSYGETGSCRVIGVTDGDSFTCLSPQKKQIKVRLAEIDAPERGQPYGTRSRKALSALIFQKNVRLSVQDIDRYGRTIANVEVGSLDVNRAMVSQGIAWVYVAYNRDKSLLAVESEARSAQLGLWALPMKERVAPWEWRSGGKLTESAPSEASSSTGVIACGSKRYCKEMISCAEATSYLNQCSVYTLDGDRDGVPCEQLCN